MSPLFTVVRHVHVQPASETSNLERHSLSIPAASIWPGLKALPWNTIAFWVLTALLIVPLWSVHRFPSQDGPLHLYNALVYRDYDRPDRAIFREFYIRNPEIVPNWLGPHILPRLVTIFSPTTAEKILLTFYLLALPLAIRYALGAVRPRAQRLAILALPLVPNYFFHIGFEDFCLSLAGYFLVVGYWLKHRRHFGWPQAGMLAGLFLLLYLTHAVATIMAMLTLTITALIWYGHGPWREIVTAGRRRISEELTRRVRQLLPLAAAMVPVSLMLALFLGEHHGSTLPWDPWPKGYLHRLYYLLSWMKAFQFTDLIPAAVELLLILIATLWMFKRRWQQAQHHHHIRDPFPGGDLGRLSGLLIFAGLVALMFVILTDSAAGGSMLLVRLPSFAVFAILLWLAAQPLGGRTFLRLESVACSIAGLVLVTMLGSQLAEYRVLNRYLSDFETLASHVEPGSTLAPLRFDDAGTRDLADPHRQRTIAKGIDPFQHASAIGLAERGVIDIGNHWATTDHQSLRWRPPKSPPLEPDQDTPTNLARHEERIGRPIDYVVLWTGGTEHRNLADQVVQAQIDERYELIYTAPNTGYMQLYKRKASAPPYPLASASRQDR